MLKKIILILFILSKVSISFAGEKVKRIEVYFPWSGINEKIGKERLLHSEPCDDFHPKWSPDGKLITFERIYREKDSAQKIYYFNVNDYKMEPIEKLEKKRRFVLSEEKTGSIKEDEKFYDSYFCWSPELIEKRQSESDISLSLEKAIEDLEKIKERAMKIGVKRQKLERINEYIENANKYKMGKDYSRGLKCVEDALNFLGFQQFVFTKDFDLYEGVIIDNTRGISPFVSIENIPNTYPDWSKKDEIIFVSGLTGNGDIYLLSKDASQKKMRRLTDNEEIDLYPRWSPHGTKITYSSYEKGNMNIYLLTGLDKPKSSRIQLTNLPILEVLPTWSKDGKQIAFYAVRMQGSEPIADLYVINSDGSGSPRRVAKQVLRTEKYGPTWLPAKFGNKIIYISEFRDGIFIVDVDTGKKWQLNIEERAISSIDCTLYKGKREEKLLIVYSAQHKNGRMRIFIKEINPEDIK